MKRTIYTLLAISALAGSQAFAAPVQDPTLASSTPAKNKQSTALVDPLATPPIPEENLPKLPEQKKRTAFGVFADVNVGTQGVGFDLGYEFNRYIKMRFRAAFLQFDYEDEWNDMDLKAELNANNTGLLVDVHPFGGTFRFTTGLNFAPLSVKAEGSMDINDQYGGKIYTLGDYQYKVEKGKGWVKGEYKWRTVQPYIGIGWSSDGDGDRSLYFHFDLGVNIMGKGQFTVSNSNNVLQSYMGGDFKPVDNALLRDSFMEEGKDFFDIADKIVVYPVLQFGIGFRF